MKAHLLLRSALLVIITAVLASCESGSMSPLPPVAAEGSSNSYAKSRSSQTARAESRPGLGTTAGDERYSQVESTRFYRKSSVPDAVDSFYYNDEEGAKVMAGIVGKASKHSGLFDAAGKRLRTGLVTYQNVLPHYESSGRRIVVGESGSRYSIRLENKSRDRVEVVVSVDGINTLSGKPARQDQKGYVLAGGQTFDLQGFWKSDSKVRSFQFGSVASSLAASKGGERNVGVIGLAVFGEDAAKARAVLHQEQWVRESADAFPVTAR